jgi:peptidoglycan/xylan/chitin deacetylase (PgdA/CDA1 family)
MMRRTVMTTSWDDGHPLDQRLGDLLNRYGLTGTFYIPRKAENVTMSEGQIQELSKSFDIGAHTMRHTFLDGASELTAEREIIESKSWVEQLTGRTCEMFCPPGGRFNHHHLRMIRQAGYTGVRTVEALSLAEPVENMDLWMVPTSVQAYPHRRIAYVRNSVKRGAIQSLRRYVKFGAPTDWTQLADALLRQVANEGGVFHLWGHSWEIEKTNQWRNLERVFKLMNRYLADIPCVNNSDLCNRRDTIQSAGQAVRVGGPSFA